MSLRDGDRLISMDILPAAVTEKVAASGAADEDAAVEEEDATTDGNEAASEAAEDCGPWALVIAAGGLGKRVPVDNFRLQNRAGMGLVGMKFRKENDELVALRVVHPRDELMLVTQRGIIIRQSIDAISIQSRMATGVQLQRLDGDDAIAAVAVVPELDIDEASLTDEPLTVEALPADGTNEAVVAAIVELEGAEPTAPAADTTDPEDPSEDGPTES